MPTVGNVVGVLAEFYLAEKDTQQYQDFIKLYDVGLPIAVMAYHNLATPTEHGVRMLDETWYAFCDYMGIDPYNDFSNWQEFSDFALN